MSEAVSNFLFVGYQDHAVTRPIFQSQLLDACAFQSCHLFSASVSFNNIFPPIKFSTSPVSGLFQLGSCPWSFFWVNSGFVKHVQPSSSVSVFLIHNFSLLSTLLFFHHSLLQESSLRGHDTHMCLSPSHKCVT